MTKTGFILANLFHKKTRTSLTLLSVVMAFVLFGLLQSLNLVFSAGADFVGATRLVTQSRVSFTQSLPMRMVPEMDAIPGVQRVMYQQWFGAVYQDNPQIFAFAVDPERLHDVYPEWVMPEEHWNAFRDTRTGMIAGKLLADQYGWKVGDRIPMKSNIFPQKNNSKDWEFELVGIFDGKDEEWRRQTAGSIYINHAYFAEAALFGGGMAGIFVLRLEDPEMAESIATLVDERYLNSSDETKTQTEKDFQVGFIKQLGDIGMIVRWILFAVFFTLLSACVVAAMQTVGAFLVIAMVYYIGLGILGRLMPQLPVFFFGLPVQVTVQLGALMIVFSSIMLVFLNHFQQGYTVFTG